MQTYQHQLKTAWWLIRSELYKFNKNITQMFLDMIMPATVTAFVCGYILPNLGLPERWSGLATIGELVFFCAGIPFWRYSNKWIMEHEEDKPVTFELTLPLAAWVVPARLAMGWMLQTLLTNVVTVFIAKLVLGDRFDWSHTSWSKVLLMYLLMNACFSMVAAAASFYYLKVWQVWRFWDRVMFPITLVSIDFPWATAYVALKPLAYAMLFLPYTYAYEGMRSAFFGPADYLNFWLCCGVLLSVSAVLFGFSVWIFKKNMDCV